MRDDGTSSALLSLTEELCAFATGVVADDNEALFRRLASELPFVVHRYPSGSEHNGWVVPDNWRVKRALIRCGDAVVFDGRAHTLAVARYSRSFCGDLDWEELKPHLVTNPDLPDAYMFHCMWQYRPWAADWAFSVPHEVYRTLGPGRYTIELEAEYEPGEMLVGIYDHQGRSDDVIVFNTNTCHPHQANDGFAATAILVRLFQWLRGRSTHYNYRLVLAPEHLGSVFYLRDRSDAEIARMVSGIFMEMPGTAGPLRATSTFLGGQTIDRAMANALRHHAQGHVLAPWRRGAGNDETVWEAPGHEIPFIELTRSENPDYPFREYHSSLDGPALMDASRMVETQRVLQAVIDVLENDAVMHRHFRGLICLSNPKYDLYFERFDPTVDKSLDQDADAWGHLLDCLFRYFDGRTTLLDVAERHGLPFGRLHAYLRRFEEKRLITLEHAPLRRPPLSTAAVRTEAEG
ncbi:DUF4910 domain-containing protein [Azospirillum sp. Marseille-Q6669]